MTLKTYRPVTMGTNGMVASAHSLASLAGIKVLMRGGNAIDAAVATNAVLNVTQPHMCGIGGDLFGLFLDGASGKISFLNASGRSPYDMTPQLFQSRGLGSIPLRGILPVTVPGAVDGWAAALERYGTLGFNVLLQPAIEYAKNGFPTSHQLSSWIQENASLLSAYPSTAEIFLKNGRAIQPGEMLYQKDLGNTFEKIAQGGRDEFYKGEIAKAIAAFSTQNGGLINEKDLADHQSNWGDPVRTVYREHTIYETAPNTQGIAALLELNILEGFDLSALGHNSADYLHLLVEAKKLAFADRDRYITDPEFAEIPLENLLSKKYAEKRRNLIDPRKAMDQVPSGDLQGDTTYFAVADKEGNIVSCIQSLYMPFGSAMVVKGTGILLQDRGAYFSLNPNHINKLEPHKRTMHTLTASITLKEDEPYMAFGTMGGDGQPQTHVQVLSNVIDFEMNIQEAIEAPRWVHGVLPPPLGTSFDPLLYVEKRLPASSVETLRRMGHKVGLLEDWTWLVGHAQGIVIDSSSGAFMGGADPRGDGVALGL
ncbi:MAG: gamma-glutamyltransferase [Candidatus Bathyarchaeia archaeon]